MKDKQFGPYYEAPELEQARWIAKCISAWDTRRKLCLERFATSFWLKPGDILIRQGGRKQYRVTAIVPAMDGNVEFVYEEVVQTTAYHTFEVADISRVLQVNDKYYLTKG